MCKGAIVTNRETLFLVNRIPPYLPSQGSLKDLDMELSNRIDEYSTQIANYLKQLFVLNNRRDIMDSIFHKDNKHTFHFSSSDLRNGYVFFHKNAHSTWVQGVLILGEHEGYTDVNITPGIILDFNDVSKHLKDIKTCLCSELTLAHAIRKIKQNGKE